jgi:hypothetical protein
MRIAIACLTGLALATAAHASVIDFEDIGGGVTLDQVVGEDGLVLDSAWDGDINTVNSGGDFVARETLPTGTTLPQDVFTLTAAAGTTFTLESIEFKSGGKEDAEYAIEGVLEVGGSALNDSGGANQVVSFTGWSGLSSATIAITKFRVKHDDDPAGDFSIDDITYTVVPEPATMGLLGLGGLVALRRRRR